jgi:hypothetical protein
VRESESGHIEEWDDTPEAERLMRWHKSGTFEEIHPSGQKVTKVVADNYHITMGDEFIHIRKDKDTFGGDLYVTIEGGCHMHIKEDYNLQVDGDMNMDVAGAWNVNVMGNTKIMTAGTKMDESALNHTIKGAIIHLNP